MDTMGLLDELQNKARRDAAVMDLIQGGEEFYGTMRRSTNGGGENSPKLSGEDDFYELFMASLM